MSYHSSAVNVPLDIGICGAGEGLFARASGHLGDKGEWALEAGMRTAGFKTLGVRTPEKSGTQVESSRKAASRGVRKIKGPVAQQVRALC